MCTDEINSLCDQRKLKLAGKSLQRKKIAEQLGSVEIEFEEDVYGISPSKVNIEKRREIDLVILNVDILVKKFKKLCVY
ncbi:MAG: hypothetical protein RIS50_454 [Bacteroidota bacterium]